MSSISQRILKSISIFGGVQVMGVLCSLIRTKLVAILVGPVGVGLLGIFNQAVELIFSVSSLGIRNSSVRDLASEKNELRRQQLVFVIRRWSWVVGLVGALVTLFCSPLLSRLTFDDSEHTWCYAALSLVLMFNAIAKGEEAILQGSSRLKVLAKALITGAIASVFTVAPIYYFMGIDGVVPAIISISGVVALSMFIFNRKENKIESKKVGWSQTLSMGKGFIKLGIFITLSNAVTLLASNAFIIFLNHFAGTVEVGFYQAGYTTVNKYADLIFAAMAMEYYPRLAQVEHSNKRIQIYVTTQINITLAILIPVISAFLICRELIVHILYSKEFFVILPYISFAVIGTIFRAISWCMAFVILVKGRGIVYMCTETISAVSGLALNLVFYKLYGLPGIGIAYILWYLIYTVVVYYCFRKIYNLKLHYSIIGNSLIALILCSGTLYSVMNSNIPLIIIFTALSVVAGLVIMKKSALIKRRKA